MRDSGGIVIGWLTKVALTLGILGLIGFEALSIGVAHMSIQDTAATAADAAQTSWASTPNSDLAYEQAQSAAEAAGATIPPKSFSIKPDGSVRFVIDKTATTLVLYRITAIAHWADVRYVEQAGPLESTGTLP